MHRIKTLWHRLRCKQLQSAERQYEKLVADALQQAIACNDRANQIDMHARPRAWAEEQTWCNFFVSMRRHHADRLRTIRAALDRHTKALADLAKESA